MLLEFFHFYTLIYSTSVYILLERYLLVATYTDFDNFTRLRLYFWAGRYDIETKFGAISYVSLIIILFIFN